MKTLPSLVSVYDNINDVLTGVWNHILTKGLYTNPRRMETKELFSVQIELTNPRARIPILPIRNWSLAYMAGELAWYLSGDDSLDFIQYYAPSYYRFSDDEKRCHGAYGPRIMGHFDIRPNQFMKITDILTEDRNSRRAVLTIYDAQDCGVKSKDIPCTLSLQFLVRDDCLNLITTMRSQDAWIGLTYDITIWTILQELIAHKLSLSVGSYIHQIGSLHLYQKDFYKVENTLSAISNAHVNCAQLPGFQFQGLNVIAWIQNLLDAERNCRNMLTQNQIEQGLSSIISSGLLDKRRWSAIFSAAWLWKKLLKTNIDKGQVRLLGALLRDKLGNEFFKYCF